MAEKAIYDLESLLEKPQLPTYSRSVSYAKNTTSKPELRNDSRPGPSRTTFLDGLRGFCCLLVYSLHHEAWTHHPVILENAFGWDHKYYFVCFPGIRILFSGGHVAVAVFFVVSGYALSVAPLRKIQARETVQLADSLGSALFRRWFRLFLPVLFTTFVWMTSWHIFNVRSSNAIALIPEKTYAAELWRFYCDFKNFSFVFTGEPQNNYNDHAWSIPMEFRGSIVVYTALLAFSRFKTSKRLLCEVGLIWYFLYIVDGWACGLFMVGMLLCDLHLLTEKDQLPEVLARWKSPPRFIWYILLFVSVYLGGVPSITNDLPHLRDSPGWYFLSFLKPQAVYDFRWFYRFWAASLMVVCVPQISWLKGFFENAFCQYLGRISYGFYLVHGPVLWTVGDRLYSASSRVREGNIAIIPAWINLFPFTSWGPFGLEINYLIPHLILLPLTFCLAEAATKLFDEPSVKFAQWAFGYDVPPPKRDDR